MELTLRLFTICVCATHSSVVRAAAAGLNGGCDMCVDIVGVVILLPLLLSKNPSDTNYECHSKFSPKHSG